MWFLQHCLALHASCQPATDGELAEWLAAAVLAFAAILATLAGLLFGLNWLGERL